MKEELVSYMNEGRTAAVCLQWMEPIFKKIEDDLINSLKAQFRQGKQTEQLMSCHTAQLTVIDDLRNHLKGLTLRGESARKEIEGVNDGEANDDTRN